MKNSFNANPNFEITLSEVKRIIPDWQAKDIDNWSMCRAYIKCNDGQNEYHLNRLGLSKKDIEELIRRIDMTVIGEIDNNYQIRFATERHEVYERNLFSFNIIASKEHEDDHWIFKYDSEEYDNPQIHCSIRLSIEDLYRIKDSLVEQTKKIDWSTHGKLYFYDLSNQIDNFSSEWRYSAKELEKELNNLFKGRKLLKMFAPLENYVDANRREDCIDFTCVGGYIILLFDNLAAKIVIAAEGMFAIGYMEKFDMSKCRKIYDYARVSDDINASRRYFVDLKDSFDTQYENKTTVGCRTESTDMYSFSQAGYDLQKAEDAINNNDLPGEIIFDFQDRKSLFFCGSDWEDFVIFFK